MPGNVIFIIGGGPRIGHAVARKFLQQGYKVAIGRRNIQETTNTKGLEEAFGVYLDVTKPGTVQAAFDEVESKLGTPNVVVYNAAALTIPPENEPFGIPVATFEQDLAINMSSAYAALASATRGFKALKARRSTDNGSLPCVFIATGNVTPFQPNPIATTLGSGKAALAYLLSVGDAAYKKEGYGFFFASQVTKSGSPVPYADVNGAAHGNVYLKLVTGDLGMSGWDFRFIAGSDDNIIEANE